MQSFFERIDSGPYAVVVVIGFFLAWMVAELLIGYFTKRAAKRKE